jgi:YD repeat-containing protein
MKKLITNNFYLLLLIAAVTFSSCDKKEKVDPATDKDAITCKLTKVASSDGDDTYESVVEYNAQGYVTKITEKETDLDSPGSNSTWVTTYTYNASNQLVKETEQDGDYTTYEYNAQGLLTKKVDVESDGSSSWTETYTYNAQGRLTQTVETSTGSGTEYSYKSTFEYDARGNISKKNYFTNNIAAGYVLFEDYDEKLNPFQAVKGFVDPEESRNNPRKITDVWQGDNNGDGVAEENRDVEIITYKYNASGFVIERKEKEEGETDEEVEIFTYTGCN